MISELLEVIKLVQWHSLDENWSLWGGVGVERENMLSLADVRNPSIVLK